MFDYCLIFNWSPSYNARYYYAIKFEVSTWIRGVARKKVRPMENSLLRHWSSEIFMSKLKMFDLDPSTVDYDPDHASITRFLVEMLRKISQLWSWLNDRCLIVHFTVNPLSDYPSMVDLTLLTYDCKLKCWAMSMCDEISKNTKVRHFQ